MLQNIVPSHILHRDVNTDALSTGEVVRMTDVVIVTSTTETRTVVSHPLAILGEGQ